MLILNVVTWDEGMPSTEFCIEHDFLGMVGGLQGYYSLSQFSAENYIGSAVALSLLRELGPLLLAFMVAGRTGSAIAAEIASM